MQDDFDVVNAFIEQNYENIWFASARLQNDPLVVATVLMASKSTYFGCQLMGSDELKPVRERLHALSHQLVALGDPPLFVECSENNEERDNKVRHCVNAPIYAAEAKTNQLQQDAMGSADTERLTVEFAGLDRHAAESVRPILEANAPLIDALAEKSIHLWLPKTKNGEEK